MPKKGTVRSALSPADFLILISPIGLLRKVTLAKNMVSRLVMKNGSKFVLTEHAEENDWLFLKDHVSESAHAEIRDFLKAEQVAPFKCGKFPEKLLPKVCRERKRAAMKSRPPKKRVDEAEIRASVKAELLKEMKAGLLEDLRREVLDELKADASAKEES